jgi:hypothetical protein
MFVPSCLFVFETAPGAASAVPVAGDAIDYMLAFEQLDCEQNFIDSDRKPTAGLEPFRVGVLKF